MKTVCKYAIPTDNDWPTIEMHDSAVVLHVGAQGNQLCLWALVNDSMPLVLRQFRIAGTGHPLERALHHLGTARFNNDIVIHVFERGR